MQNQALVAKGERAVTRPASPLRLKALLGKMSGPYVRLLSIVVAIGLWEIAGNLLPPILFVPFSATIAELWNLILSGRLFRDLAVSGQALTIGMGIGMTVGVLGAFGWYVSETFRRMTDPWITVLYSMPSVALAPLFILWLGIGIESKVALVIEAAFIPMWLTTYTGLMTTSAQLKEVAQAFGATSFGVFRHVILPWALPNVMGGFRLALSRGLIAVIVGELIGSVAGLGFLIDNAANSFNTARLLAGVLTLVVIAVGLIEITRALQNRLVPWWELKDA